MGLITIRLQKDDEEILRNIVKAKNIGLSTYVREVVEKSIEDEVDKEMYEQAIRIIEDDDDEVISWEDAVEDLGLSK